MNQNKIIELEKEIKENHSNMTGLMVMKDGNKVYEKYFNGCDENSTLHIYSVTKSIVALLIGIAIEEGYIKDVHQKVLDFFPEYKVKKGEQTIQKITIYDLLTMTAPYKYKSMMITSMRYFSSKDWVKFSLNSLGGKQTIGEFRYAPMVGPDILSGILVKATQQSLYDFANVHLFDPLDIKVEKNIVFHSIKEQLDFNKATNISGWVVDPMGINTAGWGLTLTAMDMTKIGQLFLNDGYYHSKRVVSSSWLHQVTTIHSHWKAMHLDYGYLWWIVDDLEKSYAAMGDGGNVIYLNKSKNIVISIHARLASKVKDRLEFIHQWIVPLLENE